MSMGIPALTIGGGARDRAPIRSTKPSTQRIRGWAPSVPLLLAGRGWRGKGTGNPACAVRGSSEPQSPLKAGCSQDWAAPQSAALGKSGLRHLLECSRGPKEEYSRADVRRQFGISARQLRSWERQGLLAAR